MFILAAVLATALPTLAYTLLIWWLDRYEKEPIGLLIAAFLWGMIPAVALTALFSVFLGRPLAASPLGPGLIAWGIAPVVEEPIKAAALIALFLVARSEIDSPLDGIVYGSLIGFGFSMSENLFYFLAFPYDFQTLFWVRSVLFGLNHAFFTSIVGATLGALRHTQARWVGYVALPLALLAAIGFHALHNVAVHQRLPGLLLSWLVLASGILAIFGVAVLAWRHESRWIAAELGEEIALGTLSAADYMQVISAAERARSELDALLSGGLARFHQVARLHHELTELAFKKYHLRRADPHQPPLDLAAQRRAICALRATILMHHRAVEGSEGVVQNDG
jgi:RsiW-degrading membrane proteinase PrsW (M82 family)